MELITNAICNYMFGRPKPKKAGSEKKKPGMITRKLMGPDFEIYRNARTKSTEKLKAFPFTPMEVTAMDGTTLRGRWIVPIIAGTANLKHLPAEYTNAGHTAFLVHGLDSTGLQGFASIALRYLAEGWNVFLPDMRAAGESEGDFHSFGIGECEDLMLWLSRLNEVLPGQEIVLHGKSLGASTLCMLSCRKLPENVKAIVSDCAFARQDEELLYMLRTIAGIRGPLAQWILSRVKKWYQAKFGYSFLFTTPLNSVKTAKVPMFFVHGASDRYVPSEDARRLYEACPMPKELLYIPHAGHTAACFWGGEEYYKPIFQFLEQVCRK